MNISSPAMSTGVSGFGRDAMPAGGFRPASRPWADSPLGKFRLGVFLPFALLLIFAGEARAQNGQPIPPPQYYAALPLLYDGDYAAALASFQLVQQQSVKNPLVVQTGGNWIDSICYQAMIGECYYQMGNHAFAMTHFQAALTLYASFPDWMTLVQFQPLPRVATPGQFQGLPCPWYVSLRGATIGQYPTTVPIMQGRLNNNQQVFQGGVVQMAMMVTINPQEIVRTTCLALRRWRELLGPTCSRHPLTLSVLNALAARPALPNHWSEAYVDVELGLAYAAADKPQQAIKSLLAGTVAAGMFDHQMTSIALLELGRLSLESGNFQAAAGFFLEASASACIFADYTTADDALRGGFLAHIMSNTAGPYPPLAAAAAFGLAQGLTQLQTSALISLAENFCAIEQPAAAATQLAAATTASARTNIQAGKLGARMSFVAALAAYEAGNLAAGDAAFATAMALQTTRSLWLFHMGLVDTFWQTDILQDRAAMDLYSHVLRDPTPADWASDPLESLSALVVPHPQVYEHWFEVAMSRNKEHERALEISDMARRHRFLCTQEFGGRLLNLRWVLEAPAALLDNTAVQQRLALAARYTGYVEREQKAKQLQAELRQMPLAPTEKEVAQEQAKKLEELARLSVQQEVILREMALRREPCSLIFPPLRTTKQVQESLPKGQGLLSFFATSRQSWAFLMTKDKYGYWQIKSSPKTFMMRLQSMLQKWGNYAQNKELKTEDLLDDGWKSPAKEVLDLLSSGSNADLGGGMFEELVIVPDGVLWYAPFEALQISDGDHTVPLIAKLRIRYAPTVGLAVGDPLRRKRGGNTAVVLGRLFPQDDPEIARLAFDDLSRVAPGATAIQGKPPAATSVYSSLFDQLVVFNEITPPDDGPYAWNPAPLDQDRPGGALANWFSMPWGGPEVVVLPGYRTSAERAAKGLSPDRAANELFLSICGLMSTGARTVLISRWRTGGQTSYDLAREFVQELPHTSAADAWQRSVELVSRRQLDPGLEPRFRADGKHDSPSAENPFFWAGYLLVDTGSAPRSANEDEAPQDLPLALQVPAAPAGQKPADGMKPAENGQPGEAKPPAPEMPIVSAPGGAKGRNAQPGRAQAGEANPGNAQPGDDLAGSGDGLNLRRQPPRGRQPRPMPGQPAADATEPDLSGAGDADEMPPAGDPPTAKGRGKKTPRAKPERKKPTPKKNRP